MPFTVQDFRSQLVGGGARPNLFDVTLPFPTASPDSGAAAKLTFMCQASSLPSTAVASITVPYFGRQIKVPGNRTFDNWTITVLNDEDFIVRNAFEKWLSALNSHYGNLRDANAMSTSNYSVDAFIKQYSKAGQAIKGYKMVGVFPTNVGAIDVAWNNNDSIETYTVTLDYQWWESDTSDGQGGNTLSL